MLDASKGSSTSFPSVETGSALLIVDMITDFDFENGKKLFKHARPVAARIRDLKSRARRAKVPIVYVNDSAGKWNEDSKEFVESIFRSSPEAEEIIPQIAPTAGDFFVFKPSRSGFYGTSLGSLLLSLNVSKLIVTGIATDICVTFTAHDALMRGFNIAIPSDCSAAETDKYHREALRLMERVAAVDTSRSDLISFDDTAIPAGVKTKRAAVESSEPLPIRYPEDIAPVF